MYFRTLPASTRAIFPFVTDFNHMVTSPKTDAYNCAAWAADVTTIPWWPARPGESPYIYDWPEDCPRENTLETFVCAYGELGYATCDTPDLEIEFEKIAIYANPLGRPKHVARQLPSGIWSSKLGALEDIAHANLDVVRCVDYGMASTFMRRPREQED